MLNNILFGIIGALLGYSAVITIRYNQAKNIYKVACDKHNKECDILEKEYKDVAAKLDAIREVNIIDHKYKPDELTDDYLGDDNYYLTHIVPEINEDKRKHSDMIKGIVDLLKREGYIGNYLTVELTDDQNLNHYSTISFANEDDDKQYNRTIRVSYNFYDRNDFLKNYIKNNYNLILNDEALKIFVFLHEFGHYVDSTYKHEEDYRETNKKLEKELYNLLDDELVSIAYREIPSEAFADEWAVNFIKYYHNELVEIIEAIWN